MTNISAHAENAAPTQADRLSALRAQMTAKGVQAYLIPRSDEYMGEYVPACAERLAWMTGFTGSAGIAVVTEDEAAVFSDGRYTIQLKTQVDAKYFETADMFTPGAKGWIADHAPNGAKIGYDPRLHSEAEIKALASSLKSRGIELTPIDGNLVDAIWTNRPAVPASTVEAYPEQYAGRSAADKREEIAGLVDQAGGHATILTMPDSIAWMLNIRGTDVPHNPFALSYATVRANGDVDWFIDRARVPSALIKSLGNHVRIVDPSDLKNTLVTLAQDAKVGGKPVLLDSATAPIWFRQTLEQAGAKIAHQTDPCVEPRALKNAAEQAALTSAHIRDGVAVSKFLRWLEMEAPKGQLTELSVEQKLYDFRAANGDLKDTSFDTIAGWAGNGAIVHYRATKQSNASIKGDGLLLVDSGAQYIDGTTDITRTIAVGIPTEDMRRHFTLVLKGHIGVADLKFPEGVSGAAVDVMARKALWAEGLDYAHGTGHGVGCYLSVHERGAGISSRFTAALKAGMFISNEPGFYLEGKYGIRLENLVLVKEDGQLNEGRLKKRLGFETVTLAPFDRRLVMVELLEDAELKWLNDYHARVYQTLAPHMDAAESAWLKTACAPLKKNVKPVPQVTKIKAPRPQP